ncbi:MAG: helix-turn-helix transcriptional regulator [Bacteriovoracaceae bacterium]|jgi:putative transcriptional regulator|nr:helix-turn-helix transcriptional regulator [Bacteriovoracaceae bacterium]
MKNTLKIHRKKLKLTQTELADSVLTTRQTIYLIEHNKILPSLELAFKLAHFFNLSIEELFIYKTKQKSTEEVFFIFEKE